MGTHTPDLDDLDVSGCTKIKSLQRQSTYHLRVKKKGMVITRVEKKKIGPGL